MFSGLYYVHSLAFLSILAFLPLEVTERQEQVTLTGNQQEYFSQMSHWADSSEQACRLLPSFRTKKVHKWAQTSLPHGIH